MQSIRLRARCCEAERFRGGNCWRRRVPPRNRDIESARELVKIYLAWLAFPGKAQKRDRARFIEHINAWLSMSCCGLRKRNIEQVLRRAFQRVHRHIWAGHVASLKILESKSSNSTFRDMASIK